MGGRTAPLRVAGKVTLTLVAMLIMSITGYAWASMQGLVSGLTTADVLGGGAGGDLPADGARDILLTGMDSRTDSQGNPLSEEMLAKLHAGTDDGELNTDTLIFVRIPNDGQEATAISLPRDSYVDIPGHGTHKINSAYARGKFAAQERLRNEGLSDQQELEKQSNQEGARTLIETMEGLTDTTIDNYASINLLGFHDITNAIGGVDVCLNEAVDDPYSGARFDAGHQTIAGAEALAFVRQRHGLPNGDLDRVVRQQVFMAGLANKVLSAGTLTNPGKLNELVEAVQKSIVVDEDWDILNFAQQMKDISAGEIEFRTAPVSDSKHETPNDGMAVDIRSDELRELVHSLPAQPDPDADEDDSEDQTAAAQPEDEDLTVDVYNASGIDGLARQTSRTLAEREFLSGNVDNRPLRHNSTIRVPPGEKSVGDALSDTIGGEPAIEEDPDVTAGHAEILLAEDRSSLAGPDDHAQAQDDDSPEDEPPITAHGVTCVN